MAAVVKAKTMVTDLNCILGVSVEDVLVSEIESDYTLGKLTLEHGKSSK